MCDETRIKVNKVEVGSIKEKHVVSCVWFGELEGDRWNEEVYTGVYKFREQVVLMSLKILYVNVTPLRGLCSKLDKDYIDIQALSLSLHFVQTHLMLFHVAAE